MAELLVPPQPPQPSQPEAAAAAAAAAAADDDAVVALFREVDEDGSGELDMDEVKVLCSTSGWCSGSLQP